MVCSYETYGSSPWYEEPGAVFRVERVFELVGTFRKSQQCRSRVLGNKLRIFVRSERKTSSVNNVKPQRITTQGTNSVDWRQNLERNGNECMLYQESCPIMEGL